MRPALLFELARVFDLEAEAIAQPYAWPPRTLSVEDRREVDRLSVTASRIRYRARRGEEAGDGEPS